MNESIAFLFPILQTNSGKVFKIEKIVQNTLTQHYALEYSKQEISSQYIIQQFDSLQKSLHYDLFRQFQGMLLYQEKQFYLFDYYENSQFLDQKVMDKGKIKESFSYAEIKLFLKNLLIALYELHSRQIPGRLFSCNNVLFVKPNDRLVLMDFGFGPDIKQDNFDILAPPEYLKQIIDKNENQKDFDLKFDSWLIGTILYHLIKFRSINHVEIGNNQFELYKYDRIEQYYEYLNSIEFIPCKTIRYKENLLSFVEALLTCNREKRLSFYQIYQHQYIQDLKLEKQQEYIEFYKNREQIQNYQEGIIDSFYLPIVRSYLSSQRKTPQIIPAESLIIKNQKSASPRNQNPKIRILSQHKIDINKIQNFPDYLSIIMNTPYFSHQSFYTYWLQIQLDCLKCYLLKYTAEKINTVLPKYKHPYIQVLVYIVKKMHLIILREMSNYLKQDCFFKNNYDQNWKNFLEQYEKNLPTSDQMNSYLNELTHETIDIFEQHCSNFLQVDSPIHNTTKQSLISVTVQNHNLVLNSQEFYDDGYKVELEILLQVLNKEIIQNSQDKELAQLKQLIYFCLQICSFFQPDVFQEVFKDLGKQNMQVQPQDIINYLGINNQTI
ncbi:unnamed protein product [Paramecium pentaurelia]|uniref:Protein kinase domain-containing protein n=1 Tax=Paramecium pentaurelia TaxID=43138 RepID=A0A8S1VCH3_9CILI|nr:unnamed protein product [Paramecium pentaurelia]